MLRFAVGTSHHASGELNRYDGVRVSIAEEPDSADLRDAGVISAAGVAPRNVARVAGRRTVRDAGERACYVRLREKHAPADSGLPGTGSATGPIESRVRAAGTAMTRDRVAAAVPVPVPVGDDGTASVKKWGCFGP